MTWFDKTTVENINISSLADNLNSLEATIQLPAFQRDAVWNEERIEMLWDSMLRGFPIGSLLFTRADDYDYNMAVKSSQGFKDSTPGKITHDTSAVKYVIIDGQQRSNTILLGFKKWQPEDSARIWVDLANNQTDSYDENFLLRIYVCSTSRPWGKTASNKQIWTALESSQAFLNLKNDNNFSDYNKNDPDLLNKTWPVRAKAPVLLYDLLTEGIDHNWTELIPHYLPQTYRDIACNSMVDIDFIKKIIISIKQYMVPCISH